MATPFLTRRQILAIKVESSEGTDAVPVAADVVSPAYNVSYTPNIKMNERKIVKPTFSAITEIAGEESGEIKFEVELKGSGTAGTRPYYDVPLLACGFACTTVHATSVTYKPTSAAPATVTIALYEGDSGTVFKMRKLVGCRGNVSFDAVAGQPVLAKFDFKGRYVEPTDTVALTMPTITPLPLPFVSAALSALGVGTLKATKCTIDMGNSVQLRQDVNQATGIVSAVIVDRKMKGNLDPEQEAASTMNFFNKFTTNTEAALSYALTGSGGNIVSLSAPAVQILNLKEAARNEIRTMALDLGFHQSASTGDDELSIVLT